MSDNGLIDPLDPSQGLLRPLAIGGAIPASPNTLVAPTTVPSAEGFGALVRRYESGGNYNIGFGGANLADAPRNQYGFPIWEGRQGPAGISHAAGAYQFEPTLWNEYAARLGIKDFSPESQDAVFRAVYADKGGSPWLPYNRALRVAYYGGGAGQEAPPMQPPVNALAPTATNIGPTVASPATSGIGMAGQSPTLSPFSGPWARLMALSMLGKSAQVPAIQVQYDPRRGVIPQEPVRPRMEPSTLGALPSTPYVTRVGMRQYWMD